MRSSRTSASRFLWSTSLALALAGCPGDPECGPGGAPAAGVVVAGDQLTLTYGDLVAGLNNDCPAADQPEGIVSLTIAGAQTDGTGLFTLCVERPDRLNGELALGVDTRGSPVHVVDVTGSANGCTFRYDDDAGVPTGVARGRGVCGNGADPAGFALELDGELVLERTCGETIDTVTVTLTGEVAVTAQQL